MKRLSFSSLLCKLGSHDWRNMDGVCANPDCGYVDPLWQDPKPEPGSVPKLPQSIFNLERNKPERESQLGDPPPVRRPPR